MASILTLIMIGPWGSAGVLSGLTGAILALKIDWLLRRSAGLTEFFDKIESVK